MGPVLKGLIKLQKVENRLRAAKYKLNRCRRNVIIQENQVRSLQSALEAKKEEMDKVAHLLAVALQGCHEARFSHGGLHRLLLVHR